MKTQTGGRLPQIGTLFVAFAFACLAAVSVFAGEIEREIPVLHDGAGSRLTVDISREGTRQTATPCLLLTEGSMARASKRVHENAGTTASGEPSTSAQDRIGSIRETVRDRIDQARLSHPDIEVPKEITARSVRKLFRSVRASLKERQAVAKAPPAAPAHAPEERIGMAWNVAKDMY